MPPKHGMRLQIKLYSVSRDRPLIIGASLVVNKGYLSESKFIIQSIIGDKINVKSKNDVNIRSWDIDEVDRRLDSGEMDIVYR